MRKLLQIIPGLLFCNIIFAQLTVPPNGGNKKAWVGERIGITDVSISYDRPGVKGREGKIWGQLVPYGFTNLGFGSSKASPWRAGANENTTISFSTDVMVEGKPLPQGKYGFFIALQPDEATVIFSKNYESWGSFFYDEKEDALRVNVKPVQSENNVEWLSYDFSDETNNSATINLKWEKLVIPFKVEVDLTKTQLASLRNELRSSKGFMWEAWDQAAAWCLQNNANLEQALQWTDTSTGPNFGGATIFRPWSTRAGILEKLGRTADAEAVMTKALPLASMRELHFYARQLISQKKAAKALEIFKQNFQKNPNEFTTIVGLARGYSANGDYINALKYASQALPLAPDPLNKSSVESMIQKLKDGKDIN